MKKRVTVLLLFHLLLFTFILLTSCVQQDTGSSVMPNTDTLRVGISPNAPPLAFKQGRKLQGLEVDLASQFATFLGKKVHFVTLDWEKQIPALESGKIDIIMSGMTATPKRAYRVAFAKPYMRSGQILLVRSDQTSRFANGIYSLMGNKPEIGVVEDTTGDFFITKTINKPRLTRFQSSEAAVNALVEGKVDAVVHDAPILCYYAARTDGKTTPILQMATKEFLGWAIDKSNPELLRKANAFIDQQVANGMLKTTTKRWVPYM
jgi:ABC-type amino acid transport substrate-binding protein